MSTPRKAPRGCVFFNFGSAYSLRLLVAISSLRSHYQGPVTVLLTEHPDTAALIADLRLLGAEAVLTQTLSKSFDRHRVFAESPYETTLSFDSDMIFRAPIEPLWAPLEREGLLLTRFHAPPFGVDGTPEAPGFGNRMALLAGVRPLVGEQAFSRAAEAMLKERIDINIGVIGISRPNGNAFLADWAEHLERGRGKSIMLCDEMLVVALAARHRHVLAEEAWNCPADEFFRRTNLADARVIHYFAEGNAIHGIPLGRRPRSWAVKKWFEEYQRASLRLDLERWRAADPLFAGRMA